MLIFVYILREYNWFLLAYVIKAVLYKCMFYITLIWITIAKHPRTMIWMGCYRSTILLLLLTVAQVCNYPGCWSESNFLSSLHSINLTTLLPWHSPCSVEAVVPILPASGVACDSTTQTCLEHPVTTCYNVIPTVGTRHRASNLSQYSINMENVMVEMWSGSSIIWSVSLMVGWMILPITDELL